MADVSETFDRASYPHWVTVATRWSDNDQFGHVNNAVHYSVMDTTINRATAIYSRDRENMFFA